MNARIAAGQSRQVPGYHFPLHLPIFLVRRHSQTTIRLRRDGNFKSGSDPPKLPDRAITPWTGTIFTQAFELDITISHFGLQQISSLVCLMEYGITHSSPRCVHVGIKNATIAATHALGQPGRTQARDRGLCYLSLHVPG